jgi:hypothetical protein
MGRKSLLASTTKKKTTKKKAAKKSVKASPSKMAKNKKGTNATSKAVATKKKAAAKVKKTTAAKPRATAKKTTAPAKPKAKATAPKKAPPAKKKTTAGKKKIVTLKDLIFKTFVLGKGKKKTDKPLAIKKKIVEIPKAPPFVSGHDKKETERIRGLLFQQFDLKAPTEKKPSKAKPAEKKAKVTLKDLIFKEFGAGAIKPVVFEKTAVSVPQAPPFISGYDAKETEKIKALLLKAFDLKAETTAEAADQVPSKPEPTPASPEIPPYEPVSSTDSAGTEQISKTMRMGLCALALLIAIIAGTSFSNRSTFYLQETDNGVEVWRGKFAPTGMELVYKLDGVKTPNPLQESYSKQEISPILFNFFLDKADTVLNVPAGPDIPKMKAHLRQAADFAPSQALQNQIKRRLKSIDFIIAFHKADVALSKGTASDLRAAKSSLANAYASATTDYQKELVAKTQTAVDEATAALKAK